MVTRKEMLERFSRTRILVIGEALLDSYLQGDARRLCREAPVPIVDISEEKNTPGGAANTAMNAKTLGAHVLYLSVIGDDQEGSIVTGSLSREGIDISTVIAEPGRRTLTKKRVFSNGQLLVRYDYGDSREIASETEQHLMKRLFAEFATVDAVIISDYGYGVMTDRIIQVLRKLSDIDPKPIIVDARYLDRYRELKPFAVKPNYSEAARLLGIMKEEYNGKRVVQILSRKEQLIGITGASYTAVTMDQDGAVVLGRDGSIFRTYTTPEANSRSIGAGDTYISALAVSIAAGLPIEDAAEIAGVAAEVVIGKEGTAYCSLKELEERFVSNSKIVRTRQRLREILDNYRSEGRRIVFTNGCFDILHNGHVAYLKEAKKLGQVLIVGMNTDDSIRRLKGSGRPINKLEDRLEVLSALGSVDYVIPFHEDTPENLISIIKPDVFVKGGDYTEESLPEAKIIHRQGGDVRMIPYIEDRSTTKIIEKIQDLHLRTVAAFLPENPGAGEGR